MNQGWVCSSCSGFNAVIFCLCTPEPTFLCEGCKSLHLDKKANLIHQLIPIQAFGHHREPLFLQKVQERCRAVDAAERYLQSEIARVDNCISDFCREMQTFSRKLEEHKQKIIATLKKFKQDCEMEVAQSIQETRNSIYEESPALRYVLSEYIRNFNAAAPSALFQFRAYLPDDVTKVAKLSFVTAVLSSDQSANRLCNRCGKPNNPLNEKCINCKATMWGTGETPSQADRHRMAENVTSGNRYDNPKPILQKTEVIKRAESWAHPNSTIANADGGRAWDNTAAPWHCACGSCNADHLLKCLHCSRQKPKFRCQRCNASTDKSDCVCADCVAKQVALRLEERGEVAAEEQKECEIF